MVLSIALMLIQRAISPDRKVYFHIVAGFPMLGTRSKRYPGDVGQFDGSAVCSGRFYIISSVHFLFERS